MGGLRCKVKPQTYRVEAKTTIKIQYKNQDNSVYLGINKSGEVKYVGRSCRPEIRFTEHARSGTNRAELRFVVVK